MKGLGILSWCWAPHSDGLWSLTCDIGMEAKVPYYNSVKHFQRVHKEKVDVRQTTQRGQ